MQINARHQLLSFGGQPGQLSKDPSDSTCPPCPLVLSSHSSHIRHVRPDGPAFAPDATKSIRHLHISIVQPYAEAFSQHNNYYILITTMPLRAACQKQQQLQFNVLPLPANDNVIICLLCKLLFFLLCWRYCCLCCMLHVACGVDDATPAAPAAQIICISMMSDQAPKWF